MTRTGTRIEFRNVSKVFKTKDREVNAVDDVTTGFASRFSTFAQEAIGTSGTLGSKTDSLQLQKTANGKDQDRVNTRLTLTEARLRKQYSALDTTVSSLTALNTYITQQIAQWNKSN